MKKPIVWILFLAALVIIGCGGGGGGGDTTGTTSTTDTTSGTSGIQTGLYGRVRTLGNFAVAGAVVHFFNSAGTELGTATTNANGNFAKELPTTATRFTIDTTNATFGNNPGTGQPYSGANLFNQFSYAGEEYLSNDESCLAIAPAFSSGQAQQVSTIVVTERWLGPPPPPTGCLGG